MVGEIPKGLARYPAEVLLRLGADQAGHHHHILIRDDLHPRGAGGGKQHDEVDLCRSLCCNPLGDQSSLAVTYETHPRVLSRPTQVRKSRLGICHEVPQHRGSECPRRLAHSSLVVPQHGNALPGEVVGYVAEGFVRSQFLVPVIWSTARYQHHCGRALLLARLRQCGGEGHLSRGYGKLSGVVGEVGLGLALPILTSYQIQPSGKPLLREVSPDRISLEPAAVAGTDGTALPAERPAIGAEADLLHRDPLRSLLRAV